MREREMLHRDRERDTLGDRASGEKSFWREIRGERF